MVNMKGLAEGIVFVIIAFIIVMQIIGNTASDLTYASANITSSGFPLSSLFGTSGVVFIGLMAGLLIGLIGLAFSISAFKKG